MEEDLAIRLQDKIEQLVSRYEALKDENARMKAELEAKNLIIDNNNEKISNLEKQVGNLQLKEAIMGTSENRTKAGRRVAALIREIDECIGLLNA